MTEDELIFVSNNYVKLKEVQEKLATLDVDVISKNYRFFEQLENDLIIPIILTFLELLLRLTY